MADMIDLLEEAKSKHAFAARVHENDQRILALSATTTDDGSAFAWQAVEQVRAQRKQRHRFLTDVCTGERIDFDDGYHNFGANDLTPDGCIETSSFQRLLVKALKTAIRDQPTDLALSMPAQRRGGVRSKAIFGRLSPVAKSVPKPTFSGPATSHR